MSVQLGMFIGISVIAVAAGAGTVLARNVVYASLSLLLSLMAVAGIYILLFVPFLAIVQVLIYGGAIIVVVLFALMLTRRDLSNESLNNRQWPVAAVTAISGLGVLIAVILANTWPNSVPEDELGPLSVTKIGTELFTRWAVPFELASLLLLVALIGAIVLARPGRRE